MSDATSATASDTELLQVALEAAHTAASELMSRFRGRSRVQTKSTPTDLVSDADIAAETVIRELLGSRRPDDAILAEEGGESGEGELRWLIDPLDGTINFLFGIPIFAVSVACEDPSGRIAGVVLDPVHDECFSATRSGPAKLNGEEIVVDERATDLGLAMIATGFDYDASVRARQGPVVSRVLPQVRDIRRAGVAAIDLCWCACGRYDAYYERGPKIWDVAAGRLIAERAGLIVRELPAAGEDPPGLVAGPAGLVDELAELVSG
jgi:myo-inositol-1(or 4)-monophosphatase